MSDSQHLSHILLESSDEEVPREVRDYFRSKGAPIVEESVISDEKGRKWLVLSVPVSDVTPLVLEILEKGLGENVRGINAQSKVEFRGREALSIAKRLHSGPSD